MDNVIYQTIVSEADWQAAQGDAQAIFALHQQLRPHLNDPEAYRQLIANILQSGACLLLVRNQAQQLIALALYRIHYNTYQHKLFFLEDLVVEQAMRATGVGGQVLHYLESVASTKDCHYISLDSGTFRTSAHKFYYAHNYVVDCFHFSKHLV